MTRLKWFEYPSVFYGIVFAEPLSTRKLEAQLSSPPGYVIPPTSQVKELEFYSKESVNVLKHINRVIDINWLD